MPLIFDELYVLYGCLFLSEVIGFSKSFDFHVEHKMINDN